MSEQKNQPPAPPKQRRPPRAGGNHPAPQAGAASPAAPSEPPSSAASAATPVEEKWGEFPPVERQAELKRMLEAWEQDHGDRPGPFAQVKLTGADVYWLADLAARKGDAAVGKKVLHTYPPPALPTLHLEGVYLFAAQLKGADLMGVHLEGADLRRSDLSGADLRGTQLEGANLGGAQLQRADMRETQLEGADLGGAQLEGASLGGAHLKGASLFDAKLEGAILSPAQLEGADLSWAQLEGAILSFAQLERANLRGTHLEGADLRKAQLTRQVDLREATFDAKTKLAEVYLDATLRVADALWNGVPLTRVAWGQVPRLGDEAVACQARWVDGKPKTKNQWLEDFEAAARAYRQLAVALRGQGITEVADRFTYRALIMQRKALWWQMRSIPLLAQPEEQAQQGSSPIPLHRTTHQVRHWLKGVLDIGRLLGSYLFSWFLAVLTGYGYRMSRIVVAYALLILAFAGAYWNLGLQQPRDLSFWAALVISVTAFHGRVFSNPFTAHFPEAQVVVTAIEAIVGLVIEGVFIAMLTQRFFNR